MITFECDGASRGNPGHAACSYRVLYKKDCIACESHYLGATTNNVAEYNAVIRALQFLKKEWDDWEIIEPDLLVCGIWLYSDSQLVINQLNGIYSVRDEKLKEFYHAVKELENSLLPGCPIRFEWKPREQLQAVDRLNNLMLDSKDK